VSLYKKIDKEASKQKRTRSNYVEFYFKDAFAKSKLIEAKKPA